jgi:phage baseplate assembly protein W
MTDPQLQTDIAIALRDSRFRAVYGVAEERRLSTSRQTEVLDLPTVTGRDNLGQAVILRLLTPRGELTPLGHPDYGSRLHELVGRQNTATTRNLVKLFILESLQAESRIASVETVDVQPSPGVRERVDVLVQVTPIGNAETVTIGPFTLELGP